MSRIYAALALVAVALIWLAETLMSPLGWWRIVVTVVSQFFRPARAYCLDLWVSSDQHVNALFVGNPDQTISGRVGYLAMQGSTGYKFAEKVINTLFYITTREENHCANCIEWDAIDRR